MNINILERFTAHVSPPNRRGCRLWTGCRLHPDDPTQDHGQFNLGGDVRVLAHRFVYQVMAAYDPERWPPLKEGQVVRHTCHHPPCVEPTHLRSGTQADNMADMIEAGRASWQRSRR
jgi:hypothetical protein